MLPVVFGWSLWSWPAGLVQIRRIYTGRWGHWNHTLCFNAQGHAEHEHLQVQMQEGKSFICQALVDTKGKFCVFCFLQLWLVLHPDTTFCNIVLGYALVVNSLRILWRNLAMICLCLTNMYHMMAFVKCKIWGIPWKWYYKWHGDYVPPLLGKDDYHGYMHANDLSLHMQSLISIRIWIFPFFIYK